MSPFSSIWTPAAFAAVALFVSDTGRAFSGVDRRSANVTVAAEPATEAQIASLADYIAARYRVAPLDAREYVRAAHAAAGAFDRDPLLVLAVMAVESRFDPQARSPAGARGLMQVMPRFHRGKLAAHGGESALADPDVNALVGTEILDETLRRSPNLRSALQRYAGWQSDAEQRYARSVIAERERLRRALRSAHAGEADAS